MLLDAVRFLRAHDDILLVAHVSPDGDTLGSCFALYGALVGLGKNAQIVCEDPVPAIYRFLPFSEQLVQPEKARAVDAVICVDCADAARAGTAGTRRPATRRTRASRHARARGVGRRTVVRCSDMALPGVGQAIVLVGRGSRRQSLRFGRVGDRGGGVSSAGQSRGLITLARV